MTSDTTAIQRRLTKIVGQQQELLTAFNVAIADGNLAGQGDIQKQLNRLSTEMHRLTDELRYAKVQDRVTLPRQRARASGKAVRELVLDVLDEISVPLAPSTISEFSQITTGLDIPASRSASLRRDEERAARRDINSRPAWVAPALSTSRLSAIPRLLTSSAWQLERRLIGARTLRVNHLRTTLAFLQRFERFQAAKAPQTAAIGALMLRYARGVPGAVSSGNDPDPSKIRQIVSAELNVIEADDLKERRQAAARLGRYSEQQRLWGLPAVIDGGVQSGSAGR